MGAATRRRSRDRTLVRFPRRRTRRVWVRLAVVLTLLGATVAALAYVWTVREVRVVGATRVSALEIHAATRLQGGERMLLTDMEEVARRVESIPTIRSAEVHRALPATVEVRVVERVPLVRLDGRPELVADAEGRLFELPDDPLPLLSGWTARPDAEPGARLDRRSASVLAQTRDFPDQLLAETARIQVGDDVVVHVTGGPYIRLGRATGLGAKAAAGLAVLNENRARGTELEYIDARAPTAPVARPKAAPTPAPTAAPRASARPAATPRP